MSAERENHQMTQTDIALLLAEAADEVEIGIAPVQAVMRGGRRRRARRWAVAAATAVVLGGSTGALAVTGLPGGHGDRGSNVATTTRHVAEPRLTELAQGVDHGKRWRVELSVWEAPRDRQEATRQLDGMRAYGLRSAELPGLSELTGRTSYFVSLYYGDGHLRAVMFNSFEKWEPMAGKDVTAAAIPLAAEGVDGPTRLVVAMVSKTAERVECTWRSGTSGVTVPRNADGSPVRWAVCVSPDGTANRSVKVIK